MAVPVTRSNAVKYYTCQHADLGTANQDAMVTFLGRGRIISISVGIDIACTTTATVITPTLRDAAGTLLETLGTITLAAAQAALTTVTKDYASGGTVDAGYTLRLRTDGGTATTPKGFWTVAVQEG
jgi:hypothetical protein